MSHQPTGLSLPKMKQGQIQPYASPDPCDCLYKKSDEGTLKFDVYSIDLQNFVFAFINKKRSPFIEQQADPEVRLALTKRTKRLRNVYTVQKCREDQYHVVIISSKKPVPMLNRSLQMLRDCHREHEDSYHMMKKLNQRYEHYSLNFIKKYIYQFVAKCQRCCKNVEKTPYWPSHNLDIEQDIRQAGYNFMNLNEEDDSFADVFYDDCYCPYNCKQDYYDEHYALLLTLYLQGRKRTDYLNLSQGQKSKIKKDLQECKVVKCQKNTDHLLRLDYKYRTQPKWKYENLKLEAYKRIPMEGEKLVVAKILHGEKHRSCQKMVQGLKKMPFLFKSMKQYILNSTEYCHGCCHLLISEKKRQNVSIETGSISNQNFPKIHYQNSLGDETLKYKTVQSENYAKAGSEEWPRKKKLLQKLLERENSINQRGLLIKTHIAGNGSPNVIILSGLSLQKSYHTYGDCLYFETFSHFLNLKQNWHSYFFSGMDQGKNQVVFGACLIDKRCFQGFYYAFTLFFQMMYNQYPLTICTPYDHHITQALNSMISYSQQQGLRRMAHCYLWNSSISEFTELVSKQKKQPIIMSKIIETFKTASHEKCAQNQIILQKYLGADSNVLARLRDEKEKLCWTQLLPSFIGFGLDYSRTQNLLRILERILPIYKSATQFINSFTRIKNGCISMDNSSLNCLYSAPELEELALELHPKIMRILISRCILSYKITKIDAKTPTWYVVEQELGAFNLTYELGHDHWECSCHELYRTGLPCSHLIMIIKKMGGQIRYYLNQRWFLNKEC